MTALKLYELAKQYTDLELLAESDDVPAEVLRDTLEGLTGDIQAKCTNIAKLVRNLETAADVVEEAAKKMIERSKRLRGRAEGIKSYTLLQMQMMNLTKIQCPEFTLSVRNNPESVVFNSVEDIPPQFMVQPEPPPPKPDKAALKAALKAGTVIPGVWLESGQRLEIRV